MVQDVERLGANAILDVRFSTSDIASGAAEILVYGTAVLVEDDALAAKGTEISERRSPAHNGLVEPRMKTNFVARASCP
jgi:hypothetical protein